jgi:WD40 repeat-containing protein SMU1
MKTVHLKCLPCPFSVVKLVAQFLRENGLKDTLKTLQLESGVELNIVEDAGALRRNILEGRWDIVLADIADLFLPSDLLLQLYELVLFRFLVLRI